MNKTIPTFESDFQNNHIEQNSSNQTSVGAASILSPQFGGPSSTANNCGNIEKKFEDKKMIYKVGS